MKYLFFFFLLGCTDTENPKPVNDNELITTVILDFSPTAGGSPFSATWADPEDDGSPVIDTIVLTDHTTYDMSVRFLNELAVPTEEITEEITDEVAAEPSVHQVFFTGADALLHLSYNDTDPNGFPVGLDNSVETLTTGTGSLMVTLRHMPPQNDIAVKTGSLVEDLSSVGFEGLPGSTDVQVELPIEVQ